MFHIGEFRVGRKVPYGLVFPNDLEGYAPPVAYATMTFLPMSDLP